MTVSAIAASTSSVHRRTTTPAVRAAATMSVVAGDRVVGGVQVAHRAGGDGLADRLRPLGEEQTRPSTRRTPGQAGHRPHPLGAGVGQDFAHPGVLVLRGAARGASGAAQAAEPSVAGRASRAVVTSTANAAASLTAISASMRRSTSMPARFRPWMNRL